mgnify:CR=1 FL=1
MAGSRKRGGRPVGETIGGILAGFDQQIMRTTPPPHELVRKGAPIRGLSGESAGDLTLTLPATEPTLTGDLTLMLPATELPLPPAGVPDPETTSTTESD